MNIKKYILWGSKLITIVILVLFYNTLTDLSSSTRTYPNHVHKILYIDRNFTEEETAIIISAALSWSESTNHIIEYDIVMLPVYRRINSKNAIIITKMSPDHPDILGSDDNRVGNTLGYYSEDSSFHYIALVSDSIGDDPIKYKAVVLHELGHSLGLSHNEGIDGMGTLMYPSATFSSESITYADLQNFCKLYHCDASKLKH